MINRIISLPAQGSFFLFGPRQTGKSTLVHERFKSAVWEINLLHTDQFFKYSKSPDLLRREAAHKIDQEHVRTIFIDEIQKVPLLLDEIQAILQAHPRCRFILTGSSARKLKRGASNLLGGRVLQRFLFPLVYQEYGKGFDLGDVLRFGSLPPIYGKAEPEKIDILKAYSATYLKEEIQAEGISRNLGGFARFLEVAAAQCGELVNFTGVGQDAGLPTRTVQSYYEILEDTLVALRLEGWRRSVRKRLAVHPKFYFFDLGVTNAINRRLAEGPDPAVRGRLFEQLMILETHRWLRYRQSEDRMFYWRTNTGSEVDLILERGGRIYAAIEIKYRKKITGADLSGLRSLATEHPQAVKYMVALVDHPYELEGVSIIPWRKYLEKLPRGKIL